MLHVTLHYWLNCFIKVSDNMLVFVIIFVSRFGRYCTKNVIGGYYAEAAWGLCLFNNVSFVSYIITLTPSVNGFAELPAALISETWLSSRYSF